MNFIDKMNEYGKRRIPFLFIIDMDMQNPIIMPLSEIDKNKMLYNINGIKNYENDIKINKEFDLKTYPISYDEYLSSFNVVKHNIKYGNSYLTNLTKPTKIEIDLSLEDIFLASKAKYKLLFEDKFVVFSPEEFVSINNNIISTHPMKGTIDATIPDAENIILSDEKETAEHNTIVDLLRNDLSIVAKDVQVKRFRYITKLKTHQKELLQVSSEIIGELDENWQSNIGSIFAKLLPAGSVTGAPKKKTVEIIKEAEQYDRGYYTGVAGIFDGENVESFVMIRFIENINGELYFKSGGGITYKSEPEKEYQEMIDKVYVPIY
jgi:para-aminobenzoate synthetase component 1